MKKLYIIILSIIANFSFAYSQNLFIPNWGQWNDNIMFSTENHSLYFTQNAIFNQYSFRKDSSNISLIIKTSFPGSNNINVCGADSFA